jgi:hypothetical protein
MTSLEYKLLPIIQLIQQEDFAKAREAFVALDVIDSPEHLNQPKETRLLIWALYEFLVLGNDHYATRADILKSFQNIRDK